MMNFYIDTNGEIRRRITSNMAPPICVTAPQSLACADCLDSNSDMKTCWYCYDLELKTYNKEGFNDEESTFFEKYCTEPK